MTRTTSRLIPLLALLLCACGSTPTSRFYVLTPVADAPPRDGSDLSVAVAPVAMPSLLDRPQMVSRVSDHERQLHEYARWAEPLDDNLTGVLAGNLALLLGTDRVSINPRAQGDEVLVSVHVLRLDTTLEESVVLEAMWRLSGSDGATLTMERSTYTVQLTSDSDDHEAVAAAMSQALADLSGDVAKAVHGAGAGG